MTISRHNFPATPKMGSEIVLRSVKPGHPSSKPPDLRGKSPEISDKRMEIDPQDIESSDKKSRHTWKNTFGESLPGLLVEIIVDPNCANQLALLAYKSKIGEIRKCINHRGVEYRPDSIEPGLAQIVRFSHGSAPFGSDKDLASGIEEFLSMYIDQDPRTLKLLIAFVFATWFLDCFQVAPVLWLHGPEHEVGMVMRLLNSVCYHPILLSDLDFAALRTLPAGLQVTLLVKQVDLPPRVERALLNSARRPFHVAIGKQPLDIFGARALHCESSNTQLGLSVFINPAQRILPTLTDREERSIADEFQSHLMAYRLSHYQQVQKFEIPADANQAGFEDEIKTWLAAIGDCSELDKSVRQAFAERRAESSAVRYEDPKILVVECALMFCHKKDIKQFFVRELAEKVNDLLLGRHANFKVEDRKVGSLLDDLGIQKRRVTRGFRVDLTPETRKRIHHIALAYNVLSAKAEVSHCGECKNNNQSA